MEVEGVIVNGGGTNTANNDDAGLKSQGGVPSPTGSTNGSKWEEDLTASGEDLSPRPIKAGRDLKGSFLSAVGNTISLTEPLGVPTINPEETTSSSSADESEPPIPIPQRNRRMSSIMRAEQAALSLSKSMLPLAAVAAAPANEDVSGDAPYFANAKPAASRVRRIAIDDVKEPLRSLLGATPEYPGGVGGRVSVSSPSGRPSNGTTAGRRYRITFDKHALGTAASVPLPWGLEAAQDGTGGMMSIRELLLPGSGVQRIEGEENVGDVIARINAVPTAAGGREATYRVFLVGDEVAGEAMAVRMTTHPARLAAPRETRAVLLLPERGGGSGRGIRGISVWDSDEASRGKGLWEAAADGKIDGEIIELRNKRAVWSEATESFELDLLEAWRPGQIGTVPSPPKSSPSAPETVQMVKFNRQRSGDSTAKSGNSTAREDESRLPSMQLTRAPGAEGGFVRRVDGGSVGDVPYLAAIAAPMPVLHGFCLAVIGIETRMVGAAVTLVDRSAAAGREAAAGFVGFDQALTEDRKDTSVVTPRTANAAVDSDPSSRPSPGLLPPSARSTRSGSSGGDHRGAPSHGLMSRRDSYVVGGNVHTLGGSLAENNAQSVDQGATLHRDQNGGEGVPSVPGLALGVVSAPAPDTKRGENSGTKNSRGASARKSSRRRDDTPRSAPKSETQDKASSSTTSGRTTENSKRGSKNGEGDGSDAGGGDSTPAGTVAVPVKRRMSVQQAAAKIVDKVYRNTYVCNLCLLTLTVAFGADLYPGAPSHNVPLSAALLWASCNVDGVRPLRGRSFAYALSVVVLMSLFMDLDFLASALRVYALNELEEEDDDLQRVIVGKRMHTFGQIVVGTVMLLKSLSWQGILATFPQGVHALNLLWRRFKLFLPIWGSPRKLTKEVYNRVVALAWMHFLGAVALATMAGVAGLGFGWAPQFASSRGAGAPLAATCFLKSLTNLLVSAALFRNMDLALCLNVFGCLACFQSWHQAREERRRTRHGITYPKVILEWDYILLCGYIKIFDLLVGLWVWVGLGWSWSTDRDYSERHSIRMLLLAMTTVQTLTDVWSVFLGITVSLLVSQYLLRKEKTANAARIAFGADGDGDVEIARSLSSGRLLAASPPMSPSDASSVGRGGGRRSDEDSDSMESDEDSYSTGESETEDDEEEDDRTNDGNRQSSSLQRGRVSGIDFEIESVPLATGAVAGVTSQPAKEAWPPNGGGTGTTAANGGIASGVSAPRRRSMFAPGGNRLVYKRAFSARSSSDDSVIGGGEGALPPPDTVSLDRSFAMTAEDFGRTWDSLSTCASFRCRIGRLPEVETIASHLRDQGFFVVASGAVSGRTKIYACARGVGVEALFLAELVFEKEMHELAFTFKGHDERLTSRFVCHMHLRRVIGDHQPIA